MGVSQTRSGLNTSQPAWWQRKSFRERIWLATVYFILICTSIAMVFPLYWLVTSALKPEQDLFAYPPKWFPNPITFDNFRRAVTGQILDITTAQSTEESGFDILLYLRNTLIIVVGNIVFGVTSSALIAYALARMRFRWRNAIFYTVVGTMLIPGVATLVPRFLIFRRLGWNNTFLPLIVPRVFGDAFLIFFLRQFFMNISREIEDSARIDGCSTLRLWWQIILPLSKPALVTGAIWTFMYHWNDFLNPLIYLQETHVRTLQLAVVQFWDPYEIQWSVMMAFSSVLIIPVILVFFFAQRTFIQGIVFTGVKG